MSNSNLKTPAKLALADGSVFTGCAFGDPTPRSTSGEVCFNTSLVGYQEILTDPSYAGQIVTMTCPLIGNYGVNETDMESHAIHIGGFVVRELANLPSNYRATGSLQSWLAQHHVTGIEGIDTRALTRKLRSQGALQGVLSTQSLSDDELVDMARSAPGLLGRDLAKTVSRTTPVSWDENLGRWASGAQVSCEEKHHVVAIDCGTKLNILRHLTSAGCQVTVLPYDATAQQILAYQPGGLLISNGPGDPAAVTPTINMLKQLCGKLPIFGICLGHQLLSLALGAKTFKLKFGHRGTNQPVQNLHTKKVEITSQNHGFAVDIASLEKAGASVTHINLNDRTIEGFRHDADPIFAVQYHPEASPGPHDAAYLFDCFINMMSTGQSPTARQMHEAQAQLATRMNDE